MNIFYDFNDSQVVTVEELPWTGNLKAGTPVDESGAVANDATAIGILAEDVSLPFGRKIAADRSYFVNAKVVKGGFIDKARAEENCGITYADSLIEALTDIHFVDAFDPEFPGSGGSGSGLPDPSTLSDGTAMVAVNGEWKMQEGYGYTGEPAFEPITWDGDTEGRTSVLDDFYKVSDNPISKTDIVGCTYEDSEGLTRQINQESIQDLGTVYVVGESILIALEDSIVEETSIEQGVYFYYFSDESFTEYIASLTAPSTVHQFDPALIPGVVPAAPSEDGAYVLTCTVTDGEPEYSWEVNA